MGGEGVLSYIGTEKQLLCTHGSTKKDTVHLSSQEDHWKQFHTKSSHISEPQRQRTPQSGLSWIYRRDAKKIILTLLMVSVSSTTIECGFLV